MVIDGATGRVTEIATPFGPWGFASLAAIKVNEVTNKVYVADTTSKNLLVIDGVTNQMTFRALEFKASSVVINESTNRVYVSHCGDSRISIVNE